MNLELELWIKLYKTVRRLKLGITPTMSRDHRAAMQAMREDMGWVSPEEGDYQEQVREKSVDELIREYRDAIEGQSDQTPLDTAYEDDDLEGDSNDS